jgi:hypothetical protein
MTRASRPDQLESRSSRSSYQSAENPDQKLLLASKAALAAGCAVLSYVPLQTLMPYPREYC